MEIIPLSSGQIPCLPDYIKIGEFCNGLRGNAHVDGCRSISIVTVLHNLCGVESDVFVAEVVGASHPAEEHGVFVVKEIVEVSDIAVGQTILCFTFHNSFEHFSCSVPIIVPLD